jgi:hypothetical protein
MYHLDKMDKLLRNPDDDLTALRKSQLARAPSRPMPSDSELLRRGLAAQMEREPHSIGSADPHSRTEFGRIEHYQLGHLQIAHENDGARDWLSIHGVNFEIADLDLRQAISATAGAFNAAQTAETQRAQVAIVGTIVSEVLRRNNWLHAKVREVKQHERYD